MKMELGNPEIVHQSSNWPLHNSTQSCELSQSVDKQCCKMRSHVGPASGSEENSSLLYIAAMIPTCDDSSLCGRNPGLSKSSSDPSHFTSASYAEQLPNS